MATEKIMRIRKFIKHQTAFSAALIGCVFIVLPALGQGFSQRDRYCDELEQELARDWVRGNSSQDRLPKLNQEIEKLDQTYHGAQRQADRADCYQSFFIFGKELRRTKRCLALHRTIEDSRRQLERLNAERTSIMRARDGRGRREELIDALARNNCGAQYQRQARQRPSNNFFDNIFGNNTPAYEPPRAERRSSEILPYATYRTMCVRLCDGYYFPISYSTLPSRFNKDADMCANNCAAPAELYIYRNPGEEVQHMISLDGKSYGDLNSAWRYRKEYVKGCSCKQAEYTPLDNFDAVPEKSGMAPMSPSQSDQFVSGKSDRINESQQ